MRTRNVIAALVLLALGAGYAFLTTRLPTRGIENTTEPSFFPWVIVVCLLLLSAALLIQGLRMPASEKPAAGLRAPAPLYAAGLLVCVVYLALLPTLGFVAANIPFFAVLMLFFGERRPHWIVIASTVISLALFFLFREVFQIRLPVGILAGWLG